MKVKFVVVLGSIMSFMVAFMVTAGACATGQGEYPVPEGLKDKI